MRCSAHRLPRTEVAHEGAHVKRHGARLVQQEARVARERQPLLCERRGRGGIRSHLRRLVARAAVHRVRAQLARQRRQRSAVGAARQQQRRGVRRAQVSVQRRQRVV
jgi:hypothetical protein